MLVVMKKNPDSIVGVIVMKYSLFSSVELQCTLIYANVLVLSLDEISATDVQTLFTEAGPKIQFHNCSLCISSEIDRVPLII